METTTTSLHCLLYCSKLIYLGLILTYTIVLTQDYGWIGTLISLNFAIGTYFFGRFVGTCFEQMLLCFKSFARVKKDTGDSIVVSNVERQKSTMHIPNLGKLICLRTYQHIPSTAQ